MIFFSVIDGVFGNFYHQVLLAQKRLAAQTRVGLQAPSTVKQVFFSFFGFVQAVQALSHNDVARGAGAAHVAGVLDVDFVVEQGFAYAGARRCRNLSAFWAVFGVRQNFDNWHMVL
jgi:hypothetical protein